MVEMVILGLEDQNENYYACSSHLHKENAHGFKTKLSKIEERKAKLVEFFPFTTFSSFSRYDPQRYRKVLLIVEVDLEKSDSETIQGGDIRSFQRHNINVRLIGELTNPFEYAKKIYEEKLESKQFNQASNIRYEMLSWQYMMGFASKDEFEIYKWFYKIAAGKCQYTFNITNDNLSYLPLIMKDEGFDVEIYHSAISDAIPVNYDVVFQVVNQLPDEEFALFHMKTYYRHLKECSAQRINKSMFEHILKISDVELNDLIDYMPNEVILEYGADELLARVFSSIHCLLKTSEYEPMRCIDDEYCDDEDFDSLGPVEYEWDDRDFEVRYLEPLLPYVTLKSIPLLTQLVLDPIESLLPSEILQKLEETEKL